MWAILIQTIVDANLRPCVPMQNACHPPTLLLQWCFTHLNLHASSKDIISQPAAPTQSFTYSPSLTTCRTPPSQPAAPIESSCIPGCMLVC